MNIVNWFDVAWNREVKPTEKYRPVLTTAMIGYAVMATVYGVMPLFGEIRGMDETLKVEQGVFTWILREEVLLPLFVITVLIHFSLTVASYTHQKKIFGDDMPMEHAAYQLSNLLLLVITVLMVFVPALLLYFIFDWSMDDAKNWMGMLESFVVSLPGELDKVPTLIHFPPALAFFVAMIMSGFGAYWWHRLGHQWRPMWMLIHRPHHVPERISQLTSVFTDDVAFGALAKRVSIPVVQAVIAKLFTYDSATIIEIAAVWLLLSFAFRYALEPISHSIIFYDWSFRHKWVKWGCFAFFSGPYHLMHHSDKEEHQVVNVCFTPFYVWDILFGTFVRPTKERPNTGLTHSPPIYMNPFRIIFSGWMEMFMEFKHNKGFKTRFLVLFGPSSYIPPIKYNYLKKNKPQVIYSGDSFSDQAM